MTLQPLISYVGILLLGAALGACGSPRLAPGEPVPPENSSGLGAVPPPESTAGETVAEAGGPPPPPAGAFLALLSPEHTAEIRALGVPLVVPTAIPPDFVVSQVKTVVDDAFSSYQILYRGGGDRCFLVEYASSGVGSTPETEYRIPINAPLVEDGEAYGLNHGQYADPSLRADFPEPDLVSDWLPLSTGAYRLAGAAYINEAIAPTPLCQDISPAEAVAIVESSAIITDEIIGDK